MPYLGTFFGDNRDGTNCVSCFIRIRGRFDVTMPLIHWTPITFLEVGEKLVEFKYDYLPECCFAYGRIGHPSHVCIKKYETTHGAISPHKVLVILYALRVSGTKIGRGIGVVLIIDLGDLVLEARMSFRILSPLQPCHAVTKC